MFAAYLLLVTVIFSVVLTIWHSWPSHSYIQIQTSAYYDYIIVGGGTAGCVLARRLAEDVRISVLLIEAGNEEKLSEITNIPLTAIEVQKTHIDWSFETVSQSFCCQSFVNKQLYWPGGKILGGTSSINYLIYNRGHPTDYDSWALNSGCAGWTFDDVLPYFIKSEKLENAMYKESPYHGQSGPMVVSEMISTPLAEYFVRAGQELGYRKIDFNADFGPGVMNAHGMVNFGRRWSSFKAFLEPAMPWKNLHIATLAKVHKILFNGNQAVGVEYERNGTVQQIKARKEIILCAGVFGSPHILLLSGVGPKAHLENMSIPVVADLPVGNNFQDHIWTDALTYFIRDAISITEQKAKSFWSLLDYLIFGKGPLSTVGIESQALVFNKDQSTNTTIPSILIQLYSSLLGTGMTRDNVMARKTKLNLEHKVFEALHGKMNEQNGLMLMPIVLHPKSRGTVRLSSVNHSAPLLIDPNFLNESSDIETLLEAIRIAQKFASTRSFKTVGLSSTKRTHPYCKTLPYDSDDYWRCYIQQNTFPMFHGIGTCQMSSKHDVGVVDAQLRVKNVRRLRVVDASVMPELPSGGTHAATVMIAERAADFILGKKTLPKVDVSKKKVKDLQSTVHIHSEL